MLNTAYSKTARIMTQALDAYQAGRLAKAERLFRKAAQMKPAPPQALYNLGVFLRRMDKNREAIAWLKKLLAVAPDHPGGLVETAYAHLAEGGIEEARIHFARALAVSPHDPEAQAGMAQLAFRQGNWREAADLYGRLAGKMPLGEEESLIRIRALFEAGRQDEARAIVRQLGTDNPALAGDLLKAVSRRSKGGFSLEESVLAAELGISGP